MNLWATQGCICGVLIWSFLYRLNLLKDLEKGADAAHVVFDADVDKKFRDIESRINDGTRDAHGVEERMSCFVSRREFLEFKASLQRVSNRLSPTFIAYQGSIIVLLKRNQ